MLRSCLLIDRVLDFQSKMYMYMSPSSARSSELQARERAYRHLLGVVCVWLLGQGWMWRGLEVTVYVMNFGLAKFLTD